MKPALPVTMIFIWGMVTLDADAIDSNKTLPFLDIGIQHLIQPPDRCKRVRELHLPDDHRGNARDSSAVRHPGVSHVLPRRLDREDARALHLLPGEEGDASKLRMRSSLLLPVTVPAGLERAVRVHDSW